jgi:hypothetical protein
MATVHTSDRVQCAALKPGRASEFGDSAAGIAGQRI